MDGQAPLSHENNITSPPSDVVGRRPGTPELCLKRQRRQDDAHWKWAHSGAPAAGWASGLAARFMLRASGDDRSCRIEGVASSYIYASAWMSSTVAATVSSTLAFVSEARLTPNICGGLRSRTDVASSTDQPILVPGGGIGRACRCRVGCVASLRRPVVVSAGGGGGRAGLLAGR